MLAASIGVVTAIVRAGVVVRTVEIRSRHTEPAVANLFAVTNLTVCASDAVVDS